MLRIPLNELEEAIRNPTAYKNKLQNGKAGVGFGATYYSALRDTIFRFHNYGNDVNEAVSYLITRLDKFKSRQKQQDIDEQFSWYVDDYLSRHVTTFACKYNCVIPLPDRVLEPMRISGQIGRLDLIDDPKGYAVWLFRGKDYRGWQEELRMPLIQHAISREMYTPTDRIMIGIYSFQERYVGATSYSNQDIEDARERLDHFLQQLGI